MLGKNDADPFRDIYGPGRLSHPEEWESIIKKTKEAGVEVRILDRDIMAYAPKGNGPGQLNIYENVPILSASLISTIYALSSIIILFLNS